MFKVVLICMNMHPGDIHVKQLSSALPRAAFHWTVIDRRGWAFAVASELRWGPVRRVGRPTTGRAKQLIAIRIDPRLLAELRRLAARQRKPYQILVHELLVAAVRRAA